MFVRVCVCVCVCVCFQLSQVIVNCGGMVAVIDYLGNCRGNLRLPGIMMLGYIATHSENLAMAVILSKVSISPLILLNKPLKPEPPPLHQVQYVGHVN